MAKAKYFNHGVLEKHCRSDFYPSLFLMLYFVVCSVLIKHLLTRNQPCSLFSLLLFQLSKKKATLFGFVIRLENKRKQKLIISALPLMFRETELIVLFSRLKSHC